MGKTLPDLGGTRCLLCCLWSLNATQNVVSSSPCSPPPLHPRPGSPGAHGEASIQSLSITHWPGYEAAVLLLVAAVSLSSVSPGCEEGTL